MPLLPPRPDPAGGLREALAAALRARGERRFWITILIVVIGLTLRSFLPTLHAGWTDTDILADYACAGRGAASLVQPLTCGVGGDNANFWRPVAMLQFWFLRVVFGAHPALWHAWSMSLHVVCACMLALLMRLGGAGRLPALVGTVFFAAHPLGVEVVPALARNLELPFAIGMLGAMITVGQPSFWVFATMAIGAKEAGILLLPVLAVWNRRATPWAGLLVLVGAMFAARTAILGGAGGYGTSPDPRALFVGPVELMLPSLATRAPPLAGSGWAWVVVVLVGLGTTLWLALRGPAGRLAASMAILIVGSLALYAAAGVYSRRLLYVPSAAASVLVALGFARVWANNSRIGLATFGTWLAAWGHGSTAILPYTDWNLAGHALDRLWTDPVLDAVPTGGTLWIVGRPARIDGDPRRLRYWSTRGSLNHVAASYAIEAWLRDGGLDVHVRNVPEGAPMPTEGAVWTWTAP